LRIFTLGTSGMVKPYQIIAYVQTFRNWFRIVVPNSLGTFKLSASGSE